MQSQQMLIVMALLGASSAASGQTLLRDIRPQPAFSNPSSYPLDLTGFGTTVLFSAYDGGRGAQIWRTDGTTSGTQPVTAFPSDVALQFQLSTMVASNGVLCFPGGIDGDQELWRTDGTRTGTYRVADIWPGPSGSGPRYLTSAGNLVFFTADDGTHGEELWRTDGTTAGTFMVADLEIGNLPHVFELTALGNKLVFRATFDREPWISDGTAAGTFRLRDINPGPASSWPLGLRAWSGAVWFAADDGVNGFELWRTDGTPAGTTRFANLAPGGASSYPGNLTPAGNRLFFTADDVVHGNELWVSDGTLAGTRPVHDIVPGGAGSAIRKVTAFGTNVIFSANDGSGAEPWISDGTSIGTFQLADLALGPASSVPDTFTEFAGGSLCAFRATTAPTGREVFVTDGTPAGTRLLADIGPLAADGIVAANNFSFGVIQGALFFPADDGVHGMEPWISNGTTTGTKLLLDIDPGVPLGSSVKFIGRIGDREYFNANDGNGPACWSTDGTSAGTVNPGFPSAAFASPIVEFQGTSWYLATGTNGVELWSTDGTAVGTLLVASAPGPVGNALVATSGKLFFLAGTTLWCSDGTAAGTQAVKTFNPRPLVGLAPRLYTAFLGGAFLVAEDLGRTELWRSDGTVLGTLPITNFGGLSSVDQVCMSGGQLFFAANDRIVGVELWVSDGTPSGTRVLADIQPGPGSSYPTELTPVDGGVFFAAFQNSISHQLWFSDGTTVGTRFVATPTTNQLPLGISAFGARALFVGIDGAGREPWVSDGTPVGTARIADLRVGVLDSLGVAAALPSFTVVGSGRVALFSANDGTHGRETWRTDGTALGTWRVTEIGPEQVSSNPRSWVRLGSTVLFAAVDPMTGEEPFAMSVVTTGDSLAAPRVSGCSGSSGVPLLAPVGVPFLGNANFALRTTNARSGTLGVLLFGFPVVMNFGACTLGTTNVVAAPFGFDANGAATVALPVPNLPSLRGGELVVQTLVADPLGSYANSLAFTNDLLLVVGD